MKTQTIQIGNRSYAVTEKQAEAIASLLSDVEPLERTEQPKLAQTIEEVNKAMKPDWFATIESIAHESKQTRIGNVTTQADALRVIAFRDLLNVVAYCNERFDGDKNRQVWAVFANKKAYVASGESPIVFKSRKAMEYARDTFWPIFHQWFTGEEQK